MPTLYFQNYRIEPDTLYFLYIGELKNYGLNVFLREALRRIYRRSVDFIAVVPDVLEQYDYDNVMVINPLALEKFLSCHRKTSCRVPGPVFMRTVSTNPYVIDLVEKILEQQSELLIYMYESIPEMSLDDIPGVRILGPESRVAKRWNNKVYQFRKFQDVVTLPEFRICQGEDELRETLEGLWTAWDDGIFITPEYSAAGVNSIIAHSWADVERKFKSADFRYLASRYIPHDHDPTVLAIVANETDVYVAGVADQRIEGGNRFTGSTYPSVLSREIQERLIDMTRQIGRKLGAAGYRGIFGCDYVVDARDHIYFLEVNARKQGTTLEFCCSLEQRLPAEAPMLPELEYYAVMESRFPETAQEAGAGGPSPVCWGTYNYKLSEDRCVRGFMPYSGNERECFRQTAKNNVSRKFVILEHIGNDFVLAAGSFLGRIVALGKDHAGVQAGLDQGRRLLDMTLEEP